MAASDTGCDTGAACTACSQPAGHAASPEGLRPPEGLRLSSFPWLAIPGTAARTPGLD